MKKIIDALTEWLDQLFPRPEPEARPIPVRVREPRRR
mgnify:CR=1 FL=1